MTDRYSLRIEAGNGTGEVFDIPEGEVIVGRASTADFRLRDSLVSRQHVRLVRQGGQVTLENLSCFGTTVDDVKVTAPVQLVPRQRISLSADTTLVYEIDQRGQAQRPYSHATEEIPKPMVYAGASSPERGVPVSAGTATPPAAESSHQPMALPAPSRKAVGSFSIVQLIVRFQSQLFALATTLIILLGIRFLCPDTAYIYKFLLQRSACQWVSIYAFSFGVACLLRRWGHWLKNQRMLELLQTGRVGAAGTGMVWRRYHRIQYYATRMTPSELRALARDLEERDADELRTAYTPVHDVIQMLPLIGFLGNVLGLSLGLNASVLAKTGSAGGSSFMSSIATAFDTTLLALACTIALTVLQRLIHRQEETLLANLSEYVGTQVEDHLPESKTGNEGHNADVMLMVAELRTALNELCRQVSDQVGRTLTSQGRDLVVSMEAQMSSFQSAMKTVQNNINASGTAFCSGLKEQVAGSAEMFGKAVRDTVATALSQLRSEMVSALAQHPLKTPLKEDPALKITSETMILLRQELQKIQSALVDAGEENRQAYVRLGEAMETRLAAMFKQFESLRPAATVDANEVVKALRECVMEFSRQTEKLLKQPRRVSIVDLDGTRETAAE